MGRERERAGKRLKRVFKGARKMGGIAREVQETERERGGRSRTPDGEECGALTVPV